MDSFFDYIIILIIIISLLNSIFGKKKKPEQKKTEGEIRPESQKKKQDSVDILEQLFGIPSEKKEPEYYGEKDKEIETWNPEAEFNKTDVKPPPVVETLTKEPSRFERLQSVEFTPLKENRHTDLLYTEKAKIIKRNIRREEIINRLKNPKTIRDYILVSEILGKPKALKD